MVHFISELVFTHGPTISRTISRTQADQAIETPLYFSLGRERLLGEVSMPTNEPQDVWILAGVALFLKD